MDENAHWKWDIIFKWIGLFGVLVSAWWTVHKYYEDRLQDRNSFIFQHQATLYLDAARSAAAIATSTDERARQRFEELYWGELVVVEDRRVEIAMKAFHECLMTNATGKADTPCKRVPLDQHDREIPGQKLNERVDLKHLSLELGACIRSALQEDRQVKFGHVQSAESTCPYD